MKNSAEPQLKKTTTPVKWVSFWKSKKNLLFLAAILTISFMVYFPSLQNGFVNWDDNKNIYENPSITTITNWGFFFESAKKTFTTHIIGNYNPLAILSFAFEKMIYGLDSPEWWHLDNIILHLICVLLVFRIALALGLKLLPAAFCSLLFGIQPMRVESVAWITERKDVMFGAFYLLALYYYIKSVKFSFQKRYVFIILLSFILALLSKIQAVVFPLSMLLVDYYFGRNLSFKLVYEKWLYFLLSLVTGITGIYLLRTHGSLENVEHLSFFAKILVGSYAYIVYLMKSIVPYKMVPLYPYPDKVGWIFYGSMAFALPILVSIYYFFLKKKRVLVFGLLFFTFNIMFLLQILSAGQAFIADRFTYIAYFGLFFIYASGFQWVLEKYKKFDKLIYLTALLILGVFGYINFEQNKIWKNSDTLWSYVLNYHPGNVYAMTNRARYYYDEGLFEKAIHDYNKIIDQNPKYSEIYYGRGISYANLNMFGNALQDLEEVERLDPTNRNIYSSRYNIYSNLGLHDKAQSELEKYLNLNPSNPAMWLNLGIVSRLNKQYGKSLSAFNRAIQINPKNTAYYYERLITYFEMGNFRMARNDLYFLKSKGFKGINPNYEMMINQKK